MKTAKSHSDFWMVIVAVSIVVRRNIKITDVLKVSIRVLLVFNWMVYPYMFLYLFLGALTFGIPCSPFTMGAFLGV